MVDLAASGLLLDLILKVSSNLNDSMKAGIYFFKGVRKTRFCCNICRTITDNWMNDR